MLPTGVLSATVLGECQHILNTFLMILVAMDKYISLLFFFPGTLCINKHVTLHCYTLLISTAYSSHLSSIEQVF